MLPSPNWNSNSRTAASKVPAPTIEERSWSPGSNRLTSGSASASIISSDSGKPSVSGTLLVGLGPGISSTLPVMRTIPALKPTGFSPSLKVAAILVVPVNEPLPGETVIPAPTILFIKVLGSVVGVSTIA